MTFNKAVKNTAFMTKYILVFMLITENKPIGVQYICLDVLTVHDNNMLSLWEDFLYMIHRHILFYHGPTPQTMGAIYIIKWLDVMHIIQNVVV